MDKHIGMKTETVYKAAIRLMTTLTAEKKPDSSKTQMISEIILLGRI